MGTRHPDRNDERDQQSWSPYERDERGDRERERDRERGGWGRMDAARGDRGRGFDRYGGGGGYASERFEGPAGDRDRYRGEGGQSGSQSGNLRGSPMTGGHRGKGPAGYQRSDERIREDVSDLLTDDDDLDASSIEVQVKGGEVTLTGHVPDRRSKRLAEDLLDRVAGIKDITNSLRVQPATPHGNGNGGGRPAAQSVSSSTDKDADTSNRRPRA